MESELPTEPENELTAPFVTPSVFFQSMARGLFVLTERVGLDLIFVVFMALLLATILVTQGFSLRIAQTSVLAPIGMMVFLLITRSGLWIYRHYRNQNGTLSPSHVFLQTLRDWIPFILIDFIYENLHDLSHHFNNHDIAGTMMRWDIRLFGVEPTLWSQKFFNPLLTDYMTFAYALYFILPLVIMYFLSYRNLRSDLREIILALSLCFLIGFLGYVFFPCSPPRYFLVHEFTHPVHLYGPYLFNTLQSRWDQLSVIPTGAFPSLHVAISSIALIYAYRFSHRSRFDRRLYLLYIPLVISLWLSTVYLRHHWFIDILAGWLLALFCCWIAPILMMRWEDLRKVVEILPEM